MRILLVDPRAARRKQLRGTLADALPNSMFGEAGSGMSATELVARVRWDVVILDASAAGTPALVAAIHRVDPVVPVIVLTAREGKVSRALAAARASVVRGRSEDLITEILALATLPGSEPPAGATGA